MATATAATGCYSGTGNCLPALSYAQLEGYWIRAGGNSLLAPMAAAIAMAESHGIPNNVNPTSGATGLWQINPGGSGYLDPLANAQAAVAKFAAAGGWSPWQTYWTGAYKAFYQSGVAPVIPSGGGPGSIPIVGGFLNLISGTGGVLGSAGNAVGGVLNTEQNVVNTLLNPQDLIGSGIASGIRAVGASILPWILIIGLMIFSLVLVGHELLRKSSVAVVPV